jgi:hypothetical protein
MVPYPQPTSPWQGEAEYHDSGLPANMAAVLHEQWKKARREGRMP